MVGCLFIFELFVLKIALAKYFETIVSFDFSDIQPISISLKMIGLLFHRIGLHNLLRKVCLTLLPIVITLSFIAGLYNITQSLELDETIELQIIHCAFGTN